MSALRSFAVAAVGAACIATAVAAPQKGPNKGAAGKPGATAMAVDNLRTAAALVRYGDSAKDPLALITAARIIRESGASESKAERVGGKADAAKTKPDPLSADEVLARAKTLAAGRPDLLALADDVAKGSTRGAVDGPGRKRTVVGRGGIDQYRVTFRGGEAARVFVSGDGDSDLDLYVYDDNGNMVCRDVDSSDDMICAWTPRWTGNFTIRVRNLGMANQYVILHN
jgi:hypothetical protein